MYVTRAKKRFQEKTFQFKSNLGAGEFLFGCVK